MKRKTSAVYVSAGIALAVLSFGASHALAAIDVQIGDGGVHVNTVDHPHWDEAKADKLRRAYWLLEHANDQYGGHKVEAMHSVKKAAEVLGVELHWHGSHEHEDQWDSDHRIHEAKHILEDLQDETHGEEQEHIHRAVKELNHALER